MRSQNVVGVVDYQSGNIRSVMNAVEATGAIAQLVRDRDGISGCSHLVLPGVGAFGFCAERLRASGLIPALEQWALHDRKPLLGVCVGMQLMADFSEEGDQEGLGWISGAVRKMDNGGDTGLRIPHVGWNEIQFNSAFGGFDGGSTADFYFDHSFAFQPTVPGNDLATCTHGRKFSAAVRRDNIVAVQFHPEKSQTAGMRLLESFLAL